MPTIAPIQPSSQSPSTASEESSLAEALRSANLARDVREFCSQKQIENEVEKTIALARKHFRISGQPWFRIVHDPEAGEHYAGIHIRVIGTPDEAFAQGEAFLDAFLSNIDQEKQKYITLVYHSIEGTL